MLSTCWVVVRWHEGKTNRKKLGLLSMLWNPIMASPHSCMVFLMRGATLCMACTCSGVAVWGLNGRNDFGTYLRQQKVVMLLAMVVLMVFLVMVLMSRHWPKHCRTDWSGGLCVCLQLGATGSHTQRSRCARVLWLGRYPHVHLSHTTRPIKRNKLAREGNFTLSIQVAKLLTRSTR